MAQAEKSIRNGKEVKLNTNEVMHDYEFYLKMYIEDQKMDIGDSLSDLKAS
jgi:hypothetical protein